MTPQLSIIVPFLNRKKFLRDAILSILEVQASWEIIAVDDGSTDGSAETIEDLPVQIIRSAKNRGPGFARNLGLSRASGEFVHFFDSDDLLVPESLQRLVQYLSTSPEYQAVGGKIASVIDEEGKVVESADIQRYIHAFRPKVLTFDYYIYPAISGGLQLYVFRKSLLDAVGAIDETLRCSEDRDYLLRLLKRTSIPLFDLPLFRRRVHSNNIAARWGKDGRFEFKPVLHAMNLLVDSSHLNSLSPLTRSAYSESPFQEK